MDPRSETAEGAEGTEKSFNAEIAEERRSPRTRVRGDPHDEPVMRITPRTRAPRSRPLGDPCVNAFPRALCNLSAPVISISGPAITSAYEN